MNEIADKVKDTGDLDQPKLDLQVELKCLIDILDLKLGDDVWTDVGSPSTQLLKASAL